MKTSKGIFTVAQLFKSLVAVTPETRSFARTHNADMILLFLSGVDSDDPAVTELEKCALRVRNELDVELYDELVTAASKTFGVLHPTLGDATLLIMTEG